MWPVEGESSLFDRGVQAHGGYLDSPIPHIQQWHNSIPREPTCDRGGVGGGWGGELNRMLLERTLDYRMGFRLSIKTRVYRSVFP